MGRSAAIFVSGVLLLRAAALGQGGGEILDRIVATVNSHILLQSDWEDELHYEALIGGKPLAGLTDEDRKPALNRMIDQELLRQQIRSSDPGQAPSAAEVAAQVQEIRKQLPGADSDPGWSDILARHEMTTSDLDRRVSLQIALTRLIDDRLRPTIQVDTQSIETYYNQTFLPKLRQSGGKAISLAEATPQIRNILTEQELDRALQDWLQSLKSASEIQVQVGSPAP
jgi:hypothetical protein